MKSRCSLFLLLLLKQARPSRIDGWPFCVPSMAPRSRKKPKILDDCTTIYMVKSSRTVKNRPNYSRSGHNCVDGSGLDQAQNVQQGLQGNNHGRPTIRAEISQTQRLADVLSSQDTEDTRNNISINVRFYPVCKYDI